MLTILLYLCRLMVSNTQPCPHLKLLHVEAVAVTRLSVEAAKSDIFEVSKDLFKDLFCFTR